MKKFLMMGLVFAGQMHGALVDPKQNMWQNLQALAQQGQDFKSTRSLHQNPVNLEEWKKITGKVFLVNDIKAGKEHYSKKAYIDLTNKNQCSIWDMPNSSEKKAVMKQSDENVLQVAPTWHNTAMVNLNLDLIWLKNSLLFFAAGAGLFAGAHAVKSAGYSKDLVNQMSTLGVTLSVCGLGSSLFSCRGKNSKFNYPGRDAQVVVVKDEAVPAVPVMHAGASEDNESQQLIKNLSFSDTSPNIYNALCSSTHLSSQEKDDFS